MSAVAAAYATRTAARGGLLEPDDDDDELQKASRGALYKRKDFLDKEEEAKSHPNRTYYYRKNVDLEALITARRPLEAINEAMADLSASRGVRTVLEI